MINKIFISYDNNSTLTKIQRLIDTLHPINGIQVSKNEQNSLELNKESQVNILISNNETELLDYINQIKPINTAYACSAPNPSILEKLNDYHLIGIQRHLNIESNDKNHLNLGQLKNNIKITEPYVREGNLLICDFNVLRKSEVANLPFSNPSGIFSEDLSQIFRYAGMNEINKWVILTNVHEDIADLIAQCIWYYAEAASVRFPDHPYFKNTVDEFVVDITSFDTQISFYKSKISGRWWVKIPDISENKWKSCSYDDYLHACEDNISSELLEIISIAE